MFVPASISRFVIPVFAVLCFLPAVDPAMALTAGIICALVLDNPYRKICVSVPKKLLPLCVIGLGGGMNLVAVLQAGASGFAYTFASITLTFALGLALARWLKVERESSLLIITGTAICGGSAIAAIAPAIHARSGAIAVSLAVVFVLNALALIVFPPIGQVLEMNQHSFGLWSALAIHDTSSVVGAGMKYGTEALQTGTSVKLARALWIVPLVFAVQALYKSPQEGEEQEAPKRKYPWFILGFLVVAALVTFVPVLQTGGEWVALAARRGLVLTLFLIGTNMHMDVLKTVGVKPFILGALLWVIVTTVSLGAIEVGIIQ